MENNSIDSFFEMILENKTEKQIVNLISQGLSAEMILEKLLEMEVTKDD